jgi:flagellar hook-associated protein FlgK
VNTRFSENGEVLVSLGPSVTQDIVVDGGKSIAISANFNSAAPEKVSLVLDPYGKPSALSSVTSGSLAGLMSFREQVLGSTRSALDSLANTLVTAVNAVHAQGVDGYGNPGGALFTIDPTANSVAGGLKVAFTDPMLVSAAAQFRVTKSANNIGGADATISYTDAQSGVASVPPPLSQVLVNNTNPGAGVTAVVSDSRPYAAIATIPYGQQDVSLFLDAPQPGQQLQLVTRDGRQIAGAPMSADLQARLLTADNGFAAGATYSSTYLNQSGTAGYMDMAVFYGAKASVLQQPTFDSKGLPMPSVSVAAQLTGNRIQGDQTTGMAQGAFVLNGFSMAALPPPAAGKTLQASDIAAWVNGATSTTGVKAQATNEIRVPASQIKLSSPLELNGTTILNADGNATGGFASIQALADAINTKSAASGVNASISRSGELVLSNAPGKEGQDIQIGPAILTGTTINALGIKAGNFTGQVSLTRALDANKTPIELGFGTGTPADLAKLGFRTGAYISGPVPDDVLVFVTGTGTGTASVAGSFAGQAADAKQALRSQPMQLTFTTDTHYTLTDINTGTVVAERDFDPTQVKAGITYQGIHLALSSPPKAHDSFKLDGNVDGTGNNENMLALAALESKALVGNKTMGTAYINSVNEMGNIAHQATIAQSALTVVHDQAVSTLDQISGVSLDVEAADLIRYQQAYQASAKILSVASQLFDSILQVR